MAQLFPGQASQVANAYVALRLAGQKLGSDVLAESAKLKTKLGAAGKSAGALWGKKFNSGALQSLNSLRSSMTGVLGAITAGSAFLMLKDFAEEALEAEANSQKLEAVLRATGHAAGFTRGQLEDMASELQRLTTFSDDATKEAQAIMLTFRNIKGDVFRQAIELSQDLATVMKTDLKSAALQVGKALQDPVQGINALRRAGVSFNAEQKAMIESLVRTNKLVEAQAVILAELKGEFGGTAQAVGGSAAGAGEQLSNAFGELKEAIGMELLPAMRAWADWMMSQTPGEGFGIVGPARKKLQALEDRESEFGRVSRKVENARTQEERDTALDELSKLMRESKELADAQIRKLMDPRFQGTNRGDRFAAQADEIRRSQSVFESMITHLMDKALAKNVPTELPLLDKNLLSDLEQADDQSIPTRKRRLAPWEKPPVKNGWFTDLGKLIGDFTTPLVSDVLNQVTKPGVALATGASKAIQVMMPEESKERLTGFTAFEDLNRQIQASLLSDATPKKILDETKKGNGIADKANEILNRILVATSQWSPLIP